MLNVWKRAEHPPAPKRIFWDDRSCGWLEMLLGWSHLRWILLKKLLPFLMTPNFAIILRSVKFNVNVACASAFYSCMMCIFVTTEVCMNAFIVELLFQIVNLVILSNKMLILAWRFRLPFSSRMNNAVFSVMFDLLQILPRHKMVFRDANAEYFLRCNTFLMSVYIIVTSMLYTYVVIRFNHTLCVLYCEIFCCLDSWVSLLVAQRIFVT